MGTMKCLFTFIEKIYHTFNNKEFIVATFVDIHGAFDSVNVPTLISHLLSLQVRLLFEIASEKSKSVIFARRRYLEHFYIILDNNIIPTVSSVTYLSITVDPKLR